MAGMACATVLCVIIINTFFQSAVLSLLFEFSEYDNVNTNTSSNVDLYKLNVKVEAVGKMVQTNKIQKQEKNENK